MYMATTVRVGEDIKGELDRLQGLVQAETGDRLTHHDLLARLVRLARRHPDELVAAQESWAPPPPAALERWRRRLPPADGDLGIDSDRIDEVLYGDEA